MNNEDKLKLLKCLNKIKNAQWIKKFYNEIYENIMKNINDDIITK